MGCNTLFFLCTCRSPIDYPPDDPFTTYDRPIDTPSDDQAFHGRVDGQEITRIIHSATTAGQWATIKDVVIVFKHWY